MDFCKDAVVYDPALPSPTTTATAITALIKAQEDAAMTMFVYHLSGMGYEAWDHKNPSQSDNDCVRSIWKMVCFTYFPRAEAGCKAGEQSQYKRPCKSSCSNYVQHCGVECCDESVQCVFDHTSTSSTGKLELIQTGYVDAEGPSAACTGSAKRSISSPMMVLLSIFGLHYATTASHASTKTQAVAETARHPRRFGKCFLLGFIVLLSLSLQGCDMQIPHHTVGNWRTKQNYLTEYAYVPPGKDAKSGVLNSCSNLTAVPASLQCSGKGYCKSFSDTGVQLIQGVAPMAFCQCERDWADPECGTKRKSQMKAFFWSVFLGFTGADYFYLGFPLWGVGKLLTCGGFGAWWLIDIVRTGTGAVYAHDFRTAQDLPHWVAILIMIFLCMFTGFFAAITNFLVARRQRRQDIAFLQTKEEGRIWDKTSTEQMSGFEGPRFRNVKGVPNFEGRPEFCGYGATMPMPHPNANTPFASPSANKDPRMPPYAGPFGPAGIPGQGSPTPPGKGVAPTNIPGLHREPARLDRDPDTELASPA